MNLYRYVRNNPVIYVDPSGLTVAHCQIRPGIGEYGYKYIQVPSTWKGNQEPCADILWLGLEGTAPKSERNADSKSLQRH